MVWEQGFEGMGELLLAFELERDLRLSVLLFYILCTYSIL